MNNISSLLIKKKKKKSSCLNCPDRKVGCHGKCDKYKKFQNNVSKLRKAQRGGMEYRSAKYEKLKGIMVKGESKNDNDHFTKKM